MTLQPSSRRRPYPWDAMIGGTGVMLVPDNDGRLVGSKAQPLEASPTEFEYGSATPFLERTYEFKQLWNGYGQKVQPAGVPRRYYYAIDADLSIDGLWLKGPDFTAETIGAGAVRGFVQALYGGALTFMALTDSGIFRLVSAGVWGAILGAATSPSYAGLTGGQPVQWARFKAAGAAASDSLYVATSTGTLLKLEGATGVWSAAPAAVVAKTCEVIGDEFWIGADNYVRKTVDDPMLDASYAAPITVGNASRSITYLKNHKDNLHIFKEDGIFTLSSDAVDQDLFPGLRVTPSTTTGVGTSIWLDAMYAPIDSSLYRIDAGETLQSVGTEKLMENDTEIQGTIVGLAGHQSWFGYIALYNPVNNASYLGKYGTWVEPESRQLPYGGLNTTPVSDFRDALHFALKKWAGKQITSIDIQALAGVPNDRLYVGFSDSTVQWCILPRYSPSPLSDTNCTFTVSTSSIYWPEHHAGFRADQKVVRGFSAFGPVLTATAYAQQYYRSSSSAVWTPLKTATGATANFTTNGQRVDFPEGTAPVNRSIQLRTDLVSSSVLYPPTLVGMGIHEAVRPAVVLEYAFVIDGRNWLAKRNGSVDRRPASRIRSALISALATPGGVTVILPDGTTQQMMFVDFAERLAADNKRYGVEWTIPIKGVQFKTLTLGYAILEGLTYGTLEGYTYGQMEGLL